MRKGLDKKQKEVVVDLGFGSEIFWIRYNVNGIDGKTVLCPNNSDFFWSWIRRKHKLSRIESFRYEILKKVGESSYY